MEWPGLPEREPAPAGLSDRERVGLAACGRLSVSKPTAMDGPLVPGRRIAPWAAGTDSRRYRLTCRCRFGCPPPPSAASQAFSKGKRPGTRLACLQQAPFPTRPGRGDAENLHGLTICPSRPPQGCARPSRVAPRRASAPPAPPAPPPGFPKPSPGRRRVGVGTPNPTRQVVQPPPTPPRQAARPPTTATSTVHRIAASLPSRLTKAPSRFPATCLNPDKMI